MFNKLRNLFRKKRKPTPSEKAKESLRQLMKDYKEDIGWDELGGEVKFPRFGTEEEIKQIRRENNLMDVMGIHGPRQEEPQLLPDFQKDYWMGTTVKNPTRNAFLIRV